jgi:hypothetical protein
MANPLYGFSLYKSPSIGVSEEYPVIGANSVVFTTGDPVIGSSGFAITPITGSNTSSMPILGIAAKTVTMAATNQTVAKVAVPIIPIDQDYVFLAGADGELSLTTHPGQFFSLSEVGPSGQYVGVVAASVTQFPVASSACFCVAVDPYSEGTTGVGGGSRKGLFRFTKPANRFNLGV